MKVSEGILLNAAYSRILDLIDSDLGHAPSSRIEPDIFDEFELMISIMRALSEGKKRITIDVVYPKTK